MNYIILHIDEHQIPFTSSRSTGEALLVKKVLNASYPKPGAGSERVIQSLKSRYSQIKQDTNYLQK